MAAFEDGGVAAFEAEREDVEGDVGACLVDDADDAEGHTHAAQVDAVGKSAVLDFFADGTRQCGHMAQVGGYGAQARLGELKPVVERVVP